MMHLKHPLWQKRLGKVLEAPHARTRFCGAWHLLRGPRSGPGDFPPQSRSEFRLIDATSFGCRRSCGALPLVSSRCCGWMETKPHSPRSLLLS